MSTNDKKAEEHEVNSIALLGIPCASEEDKAKDWHHSYEFIDELQNATLDGEYPLEMEQIDLILTVLIDRGHCKPNKEITCRSEA